MSNRMFTELGAQVVAPVISRRDWTGTVAAAPDVSKLDGPARELLAGYWVRVGQMEHASIAAFARFGMQLLGLGAPADLVHASVQAMDDETRHAELAFALASRYADESLGPASLAVSAQVFVDTSLREVLRTVVIEGCIGETVAAAQAVRALERATDPAVVAILETIARDETRHAEFAWRFVRWLSSRDGDSTALVSSELTRIVDEELRGATREAEGERARAGRRIVTGGTRLTAHGLPTPDTYHGLREHVLRHGVLPLVEAVGREGANAA